MNCFGFLPFWHKYEILSYDITKTYGDASGCCYYSASAVLSCRICNERKRIAYGINDYSLLKKFGSKLQAWNWIIPHCAAPKIPDFFEEEKEKTKKKNR